MAAIPQEEEEEEEEEEGVKEVKPPSAAFAAAAVTRKTQAKMLLARIKIEKSTVAGKVVTTKQQEAIDGYANIKLQLEAANMQNSELRATIKATQACPPPLSSTRSGCGIDRTPRHIFSAPLHITRTLRNNADPPHPSAASFTHF